VTADLQIGLEENAFGVVDLRRVGTRDALMTCVIALPNGP
jgi:hypothetical protein